MPREEEPVCIRNSDDARDIWTRAHPGARQSNGFRVEERDERHGFLPSNRDTPYGRQSLPFSMSNVRTNTVVPHPSSENRPPPRAESVGPALVDSREIERIVYRTALAEIDTNENARLKRELRRVEGELQ